MIMNKQQQKIAIKIISVLKNNGVKSKNDIATNIKADNSSSDFDVVMDYLLDEGLIKEHSHLSYMIAPDGRRFESFEKLEEDKLLPIRLARSNIEANILNKKIADRNEKREHRNEIAMWINIVVGIINITAIAFQLLKVV